jgi:hypothetical protein
VVLVPAALTLGLAGQGKVREALPLRHPEAEEVVAGRHQAAAAFLASGAAAALLAWGAAAALLAPGAGVALLVQVASAGLQPRVG